MVTKVEDDRVFEKAIGFELFYDLRNLLVDGMHAIVIARVRVTEGRRVRVVGKDVDIFNVGGQATLCHRLAIKMKGTFV